MQGWMYGTGQQRWAGVSQLWEEHVAKEEGRKEGRDVFATQTYTSPRLHLSWVTTMPIISSSPQFICSPQANTA